MSGQAMEGSQRTAGLPRAEHACSGRAAPEVGARLRGLFLPVAAVAVVIALATAGCSRPHRPPNFPYRITQPPLVYGSVNQNLSVLLPGPSYFSSLGMDTSAHIPSIPISLLIKSAIACAGAPQPMGAASTPLYRALKYPPETGTEKVAADGLVMIVMQYPDAANPQQVIASLDTQAGLSCVSKFLTTYWQDINIDFALHTETVARTSFQGSPGLVFRIRGVGKNVPSYGVITSYLNFAAVGPLLLFVFAGGNNDFARYYDLSGIMNGLVAKAKTQAGGSSVAGTPTP
jgi:hypothetical protein